MNDRNFVGVFSVNHYADEKSTFVKHSVLFLLTFVTATISGAIYPFGPIQIFSDSAENVSYNFLDYLYFPLYYALFIADVVRLLLTDVSILIAGLSFSSSLLFILLSHEAGHYFACKLYGVRATLPYFIPVPPLIGPAGTLGAFIKIKSSIPSRRATFDIGVSGPIAGFVAIIPIAVLGFIQMKLSPSENVPSDIVFADPPLMKLMAALFSIDLTQLGFAKMNSFYSAAWLGLLVTALNLMPVGQLDGGHAVYALFGKKAHFRIGIFCVIFMTFLALIGLVFHNSPSGLVFAFLLAVMLAVPHPETAEKTPLDGKRKLIALAVLLIFSVSFTPFPIKIS
ncbi:MAG: site-2 protease family protein [Pyrinomonadaceae bacterium]|nr:site-2 protease family protein [Pyrinomonadaceae bacterium]MCX7640599.1 site-2 protease family protein [Pyrinomonadaceae bacterium]MDW8303820.1 site-2 protease family protein [Acidobacteriota bacterium]